MREGVEGRCDSVSIVLSARDGRGGFSALPRTVPSPAPPSPSIAFFCEYESLGAPPFDRLEILGVRFLFRDVCESHWDEGFFLRLGSLVVEGCCSPGEYCSGRLPKGSRGSLDRPLEFVALGSLGKALDVGKLETGRGLGRVFAAVAFVVAGGGMLERLLMPKLEAEAKRSLEAAGRSRLFFSAAGASATPYPAKLSFEGDGRRAVDLGVGRRDIGRGRPLDLPGRDLFSAMAASDLVPLLFFLGVAKAG